MALKVVIAIGVAFAVVSESTTLGQTRTSDEVTGGENLGAILGLNSDSKGEDGDVSAGLEEHFCFFD